MTDSTLRKALTAAIHAEDGRAFSAAFSLTHQRGYTADLAPFFATALVAGWNYCHEDLARALQLLHDPSTVDALSCAATMALAYADDDGDAFARKCTWALADIGTDAAQDRLRALANQPAPRGGYAQRRLNRWTAELPRKGPRP
jgi:hypothetical protein